MTAIQQTLYASRNAQFAPTLLTEYLGDALPLTGATIKMEVRQYGGQAGGALASDASVDFTDEDTGETAVDPEDGETKPVRLLTLSPSIAKATIAALPGQNQPEAGDPQTFEYEVMVIYADATRDSLWIGEFIVDPGVVA